MHTKDFLAQELEKAAKEEPDFQASCWLEAMATKARSGIYHDFLSSLPDPAMALDRDLVKIGTPIALALRARHHNGEFDANEAESEAWANSPEGRDAMSSLIKGK